MKMKNRIAALLAMSLALLYFTCQPINQQAGNTQNERAILWDFPLPRTHTGILLGNGTQGLMVWGEGNQLNITIGRAGFWDHRGGNDFSARTNYQQVKSLLEARDNAGLKRAFEIPEKRKGWEERPHQMGGGRLEVHFPEGWELTKGELLIEKGQIHLQLKNGNGQQEQVIIEQAVYEELAVVQLPKRLTAATDFKLVPSWDHVKDVLAKVAVQSPVRWDSEEKKAGAFMQPLPEDVPLAMAYELRNDELIIATVLGEKALEEAKLLAQNGDLAQARNDAQTFWKQYWQDVPAISLPDARLQELLDYGLFKQACTTPPHGIAAGLQGPFLEEYQIPPWSADYHFNVNIQMIYWPTLATNRTDHLMPIWELITQWMPNMQVTGEKFFGQKGAIMMPHAVDDRCQVVGSFWTGTIDHACSAWMAQLAWLHYRYTLDEKVLKEVAWPLLNGSFEGFWAMTETVFDGKGGKRFALPVSVSPEFKGSRMDAWGKDASFQLAAYHSVAENLQLAAEVLGEKLDPRWQEVLDQLPPYTTFTGPRHRSEPEGQSERIALWEGMDLIESHRHHSHLAAIYPFAIIDPEDAAHKKIVDNSLWHLTYTGPGAWSGWCVPWAATLFARHDNADAAVGWLHYFEEHYTNEGRGTLHNATYPGFSFIADEPWAKRDKSTPNGEIMQLDGGFGAVTAILEILVQNRRDGIHILPDIPLGWESFSFDNIRTEGAFQVGATVENGEVIEVRVKSLAGDALSLWHGIEGGWLLDGTPEDGPVLQMNCEAGQVLTLTKK